MGTFLARWSPDDLPKPTDRAPIKIRDWIEAVFVRRRFYAEPVFRSLDGGGAAPSASGRPVSPALASLEQGHLAAPSVGGVIPAAAAPRADSGGLISLDDGGGSGSGPPTAPAWDAFGDTAAAPAPPIPAADSGWAAFAKAAEPAAPAAPPAPAAVDGWASFDTPTPGPTTSASATPSPAATAAAPAGWAAFDTPAQAPPPPAPPSSSAATTPSRTQLPSDLFSSRPASASVPPLPPAPMLPPSSAGASPVQPMTTSAAAAAPLASDPFSTLVPGLRGALPVVANGHAAPPLASPTATPPKASGNPFA